MEGRIGHLADTLQEPDEVRISEQDDTVHLYHRHYSLTPVTEKYLLVVLKHAVENPFVITAFDTNRLKSASSVEY